MQQRAAGLQMSRLLNKFHRELHTLHADRFPEGITGVNIRIINFLADNSERDIFQRDIEEEFSVRRSTVSKVLSLMEEKNLIRRKTVSGDARLKKLVLTEHGYEVHRRMRQKWKAACLTVYRRRISESCSSFSRKWIKTSIDGVSSFYADC